MNPVVDIPARVDSMIWLRKDYMSEEKISLFKSLATVENTMGDNFGFGERRDLPMWTEVGYDIGFPRAAAFVCNYLTHLDVLNFCEGSPTQIPFEGQLRKQQPEAVSEVVDALLTRSHHGGVLCAPCGTGKTVMALAVAQRMSTTTLIIVHKEFLADQWIERIKQFMPSAKIGRCQQDVCDYEGKDIVIAMIQSITKRQYPEGFYNYFGLIIADEVHILGADLWSSAIPMFPAKYRLGLSAEPKRMDGFDKAIFSHLGTVAYRIDQSDLKPDIYRVNTGTFVPIDRFMFRGKLNLSKLLTFLANNNTRNGVVLKQIVKAADKGRTVLVLSHRRSQLDEFAKVLKEKTGHSFGFYVGGMKRHEREESTKKRVILATYQMAKEGLDIPQLDVLVMATPQQDIQQSIGRILRQMEGKKQPIVIDPVDTGGPLTAFAGAREKRYLKLGYEIKR